MEKEKEAVETRRDESREVETEALETEAYNDVCLYCGADNGPVVKRWGHGIFRQGWDCHLCGGN